MCGGGSVSYPAPSDDQVKLQREQLSLLQEQQQQMRDLQPLLADQYGYKAIMGQDPRATQLIAAKNDATYRGATDEAAKYQQQLDALGLSAANGYSTVIGYDKTDARKQLEDQLAPLQSQALQLAKSQMDWQQKALNGELPVSDALVQQKALDFAKLKEQLGQMGDSIIGDEPGSAVAKSTSGSQALTEFNKRYQALEDEERRGIMAGMNGSQNAAIGTVGGSNQTVATGVPYSPYSSLMSGYSSAMAPYLQQQQGRFQSDMFNSQMSNQRLTGLMQLGGQMGSSGLMYAALA